MVKWDGFIPKLMEAARRNDDALLFVLVIAEKVINAQQNEPQERELNG